MFAKFYAKVPACNAAPLFTHVVKYAHTHQIICRGTSYVEAA